MSEELQLAVLKLLELSWEDIHFRYDDLTDREKNAVSPEQFRELIIRMYQKDLV
jgi:hypothetical protein